MDISKSIPFEKYHAIQGELERNRAAIAELAKYFTSGNCIPVDQATIKAADFWMITGLDPAKHTTKET